MLATVNANDFCRLLAKALISRPLLPKVLLPTLMLVALFGSGTAAAVDWTERSWFKDYYHRLQQVLEQNPDAEAYLQSKPYKSMKDVWLRAFEKNKPEDVALFGVRHELTWQQINDMSRKLGGYLQNLEAKGVIKKDKRIGVLMPTSPQTAVVYLAISRAGYVPVSLLASSEPPEILGGRLAEQLKIARPGCLIGMNTHSKATKIALGKLKSEGLEDVAGFHMIFSDLFDTEQGVGHGTAVGHAVIQKFLTKKSPAGAVSLKDILEGGTAPFVERNVSLDDIGLMQFTSGTTGLPKAMELTNRNLASMLMSIEEMVIDHMAGIEKPVTFQPAPMTHAMGWMFTMGLAPILGGQTNLVSNPADNSIMMNSLRRAAPDVLLGTGKMLDQLSSPANEAEIRRIMGDKTPKVILAGASAIGSKVRERVKEVWGQDISEGYGMSETTVAHASGIGVDKGMVPFPWQDRMVLDEHKLKQEGNLQRKELNLLQAEPKLYHDSNKRVTRGVLFVSGLNVIDGYYISPYADSEEQERIREENDKTFITDAEGRKWINTGDIAELDEDGRMVIYSRQKDIAVVSGKNVNPERVQDALMKTGMVKRAAVFSVPKIPEQQAGNERLVAFVRLNREHRKTGSARQLINSAARKLPLSQYETPLEGMVFLIDKEKIRFPENALHKLQRSVLKRQAVAMIKAQIPTGRHSDEISVQECRTVLWQQIQALKKR